MEGFKAFAVWLCLPNFSRVMGLGVAVKVGRRRYPHLTRLHALKNQVLRIQLFFIGLAAHGTVHVVMGGAALGAVGLVDDYGEALVAQVGDAVHDEGTFCMWK